ncbi:EAL domain-containing protein [Streptomyces sp. TRM43335]|uniref:EAL domain-containing protein n=1 Tax=Streptomyces taklimakanensis TaxID=2569853 RepID=A0A6G2BIE1_9ACTN|nr:EAL domain-containing protein [Streptomyces taklimakanensis]
MRAWTDRLRFAYQPVVDLATGSVTALEVLARPQEGDVVAEARHDPELDAELAALAVRTATRQEGLLPLHVNVFAATLAELGDLTALRRAVRDAGRRPREVTLDVTPAPAPARVPHEALVSAVDALRGDGFRICADGVGDGNLPMLLLADLSPDLLKVDAAIVARLPHRHAYRAMVTGLRRFCDGVGALLVAEGVETDLQYAAARAAGAQWGQGHLFAPPARRPGADVHRPVCPPAATPEGASGTGGPSVSEFLHPAVMLPLSASAFQVRALLIGSPETTGVLLVDPDGVPVRAVDRDRFLLAMSGRYGHALYAHRPAVRLADRPRTVRAGATAWEVLDVVAADDGSRAADDVAVVDEVGRCVGVVRLAEVIRALADSRPEDAPGLNPLTRVPRSTTR